MRPLISQSCNTVMCRWNPSTDFQHFARKTHPGISKKLWSMERLRLRPWLPTP